jgi:O-succinylbenzoic acid--CoA ligase
VVDWLLQQADERPDHVALIEDDGRPTTFVELESRVVELCQRLSGESIVPGATIFSLLLPGLSFVALLHAARRLGLILAVGSPKWTTTEVRRAALLAKPTMIFSDVALEVLGRAAAATAAVPLVWVRGEVIELSAGPSEPFCTPIMDLARPCTLLFTSGTSGEPKAIVHGAVNYLESTRSSTRRLDSRRDDIWLASMPLHHIGGLSILVRSTILGTTIHLQKGFDPQRMAQALLLGSITQASVVPAMLDPLIEALRGRILPASLRFVLVGGALATQDQLKRAQEAGLPVAPTYGMTETTSQIATAVPSSGPFCTGTVGEALDVTEIRLVDKRRRRSLTGAGAIEVRGPTVALGRLSAPGKLESLVDEDGWLPTMDEGLLDESGVLQVLGRTDDVIVTGGENVSPDEVEAVLLRHPGVADIGVVGRFHEKWGMAVTAVIVPRAGSEPSLEDLRSFACQSLARYKLPQAVEFLPKLPRTAGGKLQRRELR